MVSTEEEGGGSGGGKGKGREKEEANKGSCGVRADPLLLIADAFSLTEAEFQVLTPAEESNPSSSSSSSSSHGGGSQATKDDESGGCEERIVESSPPQQNWFVKRVVEHRYVGKTRKLEFRVEWMGLKSTDRRHKKWHKIDIFQTEGAPGCRPGELSCTLLDKTVGEYMKRHGVLGGPGGGVRS